jgi:hypothetical protein
VWTAYKGDIRIQIGTGNDIALREGDTLAIGYGTKQEGGGSWESTNITARGDTAQAEIMISTRKQDKR